MWYLMTIYLKKPLMLSQHRTLEALQEGCSVFIKVLIRLITSGLVTMLFGTDYTPQVSLFNPVQHMKN